MGTSGRKPRKPRRRMAKVPRGAEANNIQLAGLTSSSDVAHGSRLDHDAARGRSENINRFQRFVLWLLGRRPKPPVDE
jgi:hypothetical protein